MEQKNSANQKSEVSKKSIDLLQMFITEFKNPQARNVKLDKKIINKILRFLLKDKFSTPIQLSSGAQKGGAIAHSGSFEPSKMEALLWLQYFLGFFMEDFQ